MNEVNKTLFIPLYGKSQVSRKGIILSDPTAEKIWAREGFPFKGKSKSKWLAYNMAMRARVFDRWTEKMLEQDPGALVLHIGCGLDSRALRVKAPYTNWIDGDFPDVIELRRRYFNETEKYKMRVVNAADTEDIRALPDSKSAIVVLEGISMYLSKEQLNRFFQTLNEKYARLHILMDVYTEFAAKASKYKNPVNEVGVTTLYGIDDPNSILENTNIIFKKERSMTPKKLVDELTGFEKNFFKAMFTGSIYRKFYRLYEFEAN